MEQITVTDYRLYSIIVLYDMHTTFFHSGINGINDKDSHQRLTTQANHVAWLAGSLVQQRFELANVLGIQLNQSACELFKDNKGIQNDIIYPSLGVFKNEWDIISPLLRNKLTEVDTQKLNTSFEMMPGMSMTYYDLISFIAYREANCIGQIALWRRLLGYEAMKYM